MKFRKKAVEVEAVTFDELAAISAKLNPVKDGGELLQFPYNGVPVFRKDADTFTLATLHGPLDFVRGSGRLITAALGDVYPVSNEAFEAGFEPVKRKK